MSGDVALAKITELRLELTAAVTALRVAMLARFDRVENRLDTTADDIDVILIRTDRAERAVETVREDVQSLRKEVTTLARKQRRLEEQVHNLTQPPAA